MQRLMHPGALLPRQRYLALAVVPLVATAVGLGLNAAPAQAGEFIIIERGNLTVQVGQDRVPYYSGATYSYPRTTYSYPYPDYYRQPLRHPSSIIRGDIDNSVLVNPYVIDSSIEDSTLINPIIVDTDRRGNQTIITVPSSGSLSRPRSSTCNTLGHLRAACGYR